MFPWSHPACAAQDHERLQDFGARFASASAALENLTCAMQDQECPDGERPGDSEQRNFLHIRVNAGIVPGM